MAARLVLRSFVCFYNSPLVEQYQPLAYDQQLLIKQTVVANAFLNFSLLPPSAIPTISPTLLSPLEYGYRTKLTPHFQSPPDLSKPRQPRKFKRGKERAKEEMVVEEEGDKKEWELTIGFEEKGRKRVIDIEECVLATPIINTTLTAERARVAASVPSAFLLQLLTRSEQNDIAIQKRIDSSPPRLPPTSSSRLSPTSRRTLPLDRSSRLHHRSSRNGSGTSRQD